VLVFMAFKKTEELSPAHRPHQQNQSITRHPVMPDVIVSKFHMRIHNQSNNSLGVIPAKTTGKTGFSARTLWVRHQQAISS
jgi:hypothetical protein